jgi:hypothetical protein|tara:strand:- start:2132 stop:2413 length:282 start_codon:yes stop_codon:yes gene_type:complete
MANYPEIPKFFRFNSKDMKDIYEMIERWGSTLINELRLRDIEVDSTPTTNIYTVVTISSVKRPRKGDIVYAVSSGKYKGYVSTAASTTWKNFY